MSEEWILALFARLRAIYGKRFLDLYPGDTLDAAMDEWRHGLKNMTGEQVKKGLEYCREQYQWPPSIAEFRNACLGEPDWEHRGEAYKTFKKDRLLSSDARDAKRKKSRAKFLAEMKERRLA